MNNKIQKLTDLRKLKTNSYYTITGAGGDLNKCVNGYNDLLKKEKIGVPKNWYTFKGGEVNKEFNLEGNNAFKKDLSFLAFDLSGLNVGKLAMFKLKMGDRWSDDIINNSINESKSISKLKKLIKETMRKKMSNSLIKNIEKKFGKVEYKGNEYKIYAENSKELRDFLKKYNYKVVGVGNKMHGDHFESIDDGYVFVSDNPIYK